jgi:hypothetical protein
MDLEGDMANSDWRGRRKLRSKASHVNNTGEGGEDIHIGRKPGRQGRVIEEDVLSDFE